MPISVCSEIGPLRRVLLHRPGRELEHLVPQELERLLFDDIPYLALAQQEHDTFADLLRAQGCDVVYLEDYAAETLRLHPELREGFVRRFLREGGAMAQAQFQTLFNVLMEIDDPLALIRRTMSGLTAEELEGRLEEGPLTRLARASRHFVLDPIPNLYFTRDPFASIGCGASVHRMFSATRRRETIYADLILRHHPDFAATPLWYDRGEPFPIEGGDILNLSDKVLAIGLSQRTSPEGIERLTQNLFASDQSKVETILVLDIPSVVPRTDFSGNWAKITPSIANPRCLQIRIFQKNYIHKAAWRQGKFELTAQVPKMASKTGKWREFGKKGEKTGENASPVFPTDSNVPIISLERKYTDLLLLAMQKDERCILWTQQFNTRTYWHNTLIT